MKKIWIAVLLFAVLASVLPTVALASGAEATVGKEASLYVEEGLVASFTASGDSVDLTEGVWYSDDGEYRISIEGGAYDSASNPTGWRRSDDGGIRYDFRSLAEYNSKSRSVGLVLPEQTLTDGDFAVEIVFTPHYIVDENGKTVTHNNDNSATKWGVYSGSRSSLAVAGFQWCLFQPSVYDANLGTDKAPSYGGASMHVRFFYFKGCWAGGAGDKTAIYDYTPFGTYTVKDGVEVDAIHREKTTLTLNRKVSAGQAYQLSDFEVNVAGQRYTYRNGDGKNKSDGTKNVEYDFYKLEDCQAPFEALFGLPSTVYAIRVYNRVLTAEERAQNQFADIVAQTGADLSLYFTYPEEVQAQARHSVAALGFDTSDEDVAFAIADAKRAYDEEQARKEAEEQERQALLDSLADRPLDKYDRYYVQDGLQIFLDGFVSIGAWNTTIDLENGKWYSKVGDAAATIGGKEYWQVSENYRGIGYRMTKTQYYATLVGGACPMDISFDASLLPKSFTVETVAQFVGLTNEDGTRYIDPENSAQIWGIYTDSYSAFSFGLLKSMTFLCESHAKNGTPMGNRWCYTPKEWNQHNGSVSYQSEGFIQAADPLVPTTLCVTLNYPNDATAVVNIYADHKAEPLVSNRYNALKDPTPEFHLFKGLASTVYAVRVYNRVLSDVEMAQNHMADLLSYYGLDTSFLDMVLETVGTLGEAYLSFNAIGFDMTKEEAEFSFRDALISAWLSFTGVSARIDKEGALRFEFGLDERGIAALWESGYRVEVGALVSIGKDAYPRFDDAEYKLLFMDENGVRNDRYYISYEQNGKSRLAIGFTYCGLTPEMSVRELCVTAYLRLVLPTGEEMVLHVDAETNAFDTNLFSFYRYLSDNAYGDNALVTRVVDSCYLDTEIVVTPEGEDALKEAYDALYELLDSDVPLDITMALEGGRYEISEKLVLDANKVKQKYFRLHIVGAEDDGTVITTNRFFAEEGFTEVAGTAYYSYQFEKDESGAYPYFTYFYADGKVQQVATHGYDRTFDAECDGGIELMWKVPYKFDGAEKNTDAQPVSGKYRMYLPIEAFEDLSDAAFDGGKVEFHMPVAWYYRTLHIDSVDWNDVKEGNVAVYFRPSEMNNYQINHTFKNNYFWLRNSLEFLDEPGEFYYDNENGTLYYYPADDVDITDAVFEYPVLGHMMSFYGVKDVTLENLVFYGNDNHVFEAGSYVGSQSTTSTGDYGGNTLTAVYFKNATGITITGCLFEELTTTALMFTGASKYVTVDSCRFFQIGSAGIEVGPRSGTFNEGVAGNEYVEICNNYLNDIAWLTRGSEGINVGASRNVEIHHNTIINTSYSGMSIGRRWGSADWQFGEQWHLYNIDIHHNYIAGFMSDQSDGGAVYTLGGNVVAEYHEHFNFLHDNFAYMNEHSWDGKGIAMPYYHDGSSSNWHTYQNVVLLTPYRTVYAAIYLQNVVTERVHNVFVENNEIIGTHKPYELYAADEDMSDLAFEYAVFGADTNCPCEPGDALYDEGYRYYSRVSRERYNEQRGNILYDSPEAVYMYGGYVLSMIDDTGSDFCKPVADEIMDEIAPLYEQWWAKKAEEWGE